MIDLSHLTEEEQELILIVLKRDEELKKAEEDRIRALQKKGSPAEDKLKYLTGEWFYEAKSQRHTDKIHGSEIILASMKQRKAGALDRSLSLPRTASDAGSDIVIPPKPPRCLETPEQLQETRESLSFPEADETRRNVILCSPARPRHNPFNQASIVPEESENTEPISLYICHPAGPASPTSAGSVTSEGSSVGFRPVPKKRTFLSRKQSPVLDGEGPLSGRVPLAVFIVPVPRERHRHHSSGGLSPSSEGGITTASIAESQNNPPSQPMNTPNQEEKPFTRLSTVEGSPDDLFKRTSPARVPSLLKEIKKGPVALNEPEVHTPLDLKWALFSDGDRHNERLISGGQRSGNRDGFIQGEHDESCFTNRERSHGPFSEPLSPLLSKAPTSSSPTGQPSGQQYAAFELTQSQDDEKEVEEKTDTRNVGTAIRQVDLNQPVPYDLQISDDKQSNKQSQVKMSGWKAASKPSPRNATPTGEGGDSIVKVLEWFSRSTDSNDWLETESREQGDADQEEEMAMDDVIEATRRDRGDVYENRYQLRERTAPWGKRDHPQEDVSSDEQDAGQRWKDSTNVAEREEEVKIVTGVQVRPQEAKASEDDHQDDQRPTISHLKSFWERGNTGPKILISRSNTGVENGLRPVHQTTEKEKERAREQVEEERTPYTADTHSIAALERVDGKSCAKFRVKEHDQITLDEKHQAISGNDSTTRRGVGVPTTGIRTSPGPHRREDHKHTADYLTLAEDPQVLDRRDNEILSLTGLSLQPELNLQSSLTPETDKPSPSRLSPEPGAVSLDCDTQYTLVQSRASPQPDTFLQSRASPQPVKSPTRTITPQPELLSRSSPQPGMPHYARDSPECDKPEQQSRISPHMEYLTGGIDKEQFTPNAETRNSTCGNVKGEEEEKRSVQSSVPPKKQDDPTFKDRGNSPHTRRPPPPYQESAAEMKKIRQLKSFWEQEKNRPVCRTGKSKELGDARLTSAPSKLNKRFTKSEYDLRSIVNESDSDDDSNLSSDRKPFTIISMNQRLSPNLGNRSQFENLRDFWGDATSNHKGTTSSDEPKSPKKKESVDSQHSKLESKQRIDSVKGNKEREHRPRSPNDRPIGAGAGPVIDSKANLSHCIPVNSEQQRGPRPALLKRGSVQNPTTEEKPPRPQGTMGKDSRLPKTRKDSFGNSSGRASGMRHARSMFALNVTDQPEPDKTSPGQRRKTHEASPVQGKKTALRRQSAERGPSSRSSRSSEESESLAPRARAFVPRDYRHYLGITEKTGVHASLAPPATKEREAEGKVGAELDLSGPVRTSTPTGSEERYGRRGGKTAQQHPLRPNLASAETSRESCPSSASDTRSNSRTSSNRENEEENPVRKALKRAETRSKNLARSLEDITAFLPSRQDRRRDPVADPRPGSGASSQTGPSSSSFSDPERLKKLSKSVPSFLQKEGDGCETDSASEDDSYHGGRQMFDRSMTNLSTSSGMASTSSLMTMYSGDFGNIEVQGNIQFSINYVQKLREFHIFVAQCRDLAAVDPKRGRSDPYVKSYLMPDKAKLGKRKTSVKKKTLNPTFNEILRYRVRMEYLRTQTLFLSVWHHDTFGKNCFLGEVDMDLSKWDFDHAQMIYLALKARPSPQPADERGEMRLAIRFLPQIAHSQVKEGPNTGEVHIWVKECKNLPLVRGAVIDPYVKCFVLPDTSRKSRQKTRVLRRTANPTFNHTMVYDGFQREDLREACVELTVWDRDKLASSLLGGLRLGPGTGRSYGAVVDWMDSTSCEVALWERMMASPDEWVEDVLPLRMLTTAKTAVK